MPDFCLGARYRPHHPSTPALRARVGLSRMIPSPSRNWFDLRKADGDDLGNATRSCCCEAADFRRIEINQAAMGSEWRPTTEMVLGRYAHITGYDAATGDNDSGTYTDDDMADWTTHGIDLAPLQVEDVPTWCIVDGTDPVEVAFAIDRTGPVLVTLALPATWEDLSTWAQAPGVGASWAKNSGGQHRVLFGAYEAVGGFLTARTWGIDVSVHPEWFAAYVMAVDAVPSLAWFRSRPELVLPGSVWDEMAAVKRALS